MGLSLGFGLGPVRASIPLSGGRKKPSRPATENEVTIAVGVAMMAIPVIAVSLLSEYTHIGDPTTVAISGGLLLGAVWAALLSFSHKKSEAEQEADSMAIVWLIALVANVLVTVPCALIWGLIALFHAIGPIGSTGIWLLIGTAVFCVMCWLGNKKMPMP
jgi:hypothetical protein